MISLRLDRQKRRETKYLYMFTAPWILGFIVFTAGPLILSAYYSLNQYNISSHPIWIGFSNYVDLFKDTLFWQSLKVTGIYTGISVPINIILAFGIALLVNVKIPGQRIFRTAIYLPTLVSGVVMSLLWLWLLNPQFGIINYLLNTLFGIHGPQWVYSQQWVLPALIIMGVWGVGYNMVLYLAALQGVSRSLYEAADIDGASTWGKLIHITIPLVSPTTLFLFITGIIQTSQVFTQAAVMTQGGPDYGSYFYVYYLYQQAFGSFNIGYASAMAWVLLVLVFILTWVLMKTSNRWVHY